MAPCQDWVLALSQEPAVAGEEVGQLDGAAVDGGHLGQAVERGAGTKGGGQRILLLLRQEGLGVQLGQEEIAAAHRQGVGTRQAGVA